VATVLSENGADIDLVIAGFLHDILEDTKITEEELIAKFGKKITFLVKEVTEDKSKSWEERKENTLEHLKVASLEVKMLECADHLVNNSELLKEYLIHGDDVWKVFNRGKKEKGAYELKIVDALKDLDNLKMYQELRKVTNDLLNK
jgi:(p)ppGpp synthase/HD superfamily hydrolase